MKTTIITQKTINLSLFNHGNSNLGHPKVSQWAKARNGERQNQ